ncbi:MAG TPA: hypothetical protein VF363_00915 [Candidatus Eisenbacteria bacterium]
MPARLAAHLLPRVVLPGRDQMELDRALLDWAAASPERLVVRVYGWARPTLSLGRAEPYPEGWDEAALAVEGIDVVRRPTGGDAVLHDDEATFAVAGSVPGPWSRGPRAFALAVADAVAAALRSLDVPASVVSRGTEALPPGRPGDRPCFARTAAGEVRVLGRKAAGIASRFAAGGALSHGSVPLSARHRDVARFRVGRVEEEALLRGHTLSVGEALGRAVPRGEVEARLVGAIEDRFGVILSRREFADLGLAAVTRAPLC